MRLWLLFACLLPSVEARAAWLDWWVNADQRGIELLNNDRAELAGETFSNPDWRGTAKFLAGNFVEAADEFSRSDDIEAIYNRATSLARAGQLEESLAEFDRLLDRQSTHGDGLFNREIVQRQLEQQPPPPQDSPRQEQSGDSDSGQQQEGESQPQEGGGEGDQNPPQQAGDKSAEDRANEQTADANRDQSAAEELKSALENSDSPDQSQPEQRQLAGTAAEQQTWDEASQAIEQQLQRIPDDPAGLLRNKLRATHASRYADIRQSRQPW